MTTDPSCDFCGIVAGREAAEIIERAERWVAFFPLHPATPGHTLIIPTQHVSDFWQAEPAVATDVSAAAHRIGRAIRHALAPDGLNLITSAGETAEQTVFHLHLHVVPRWPGDRIDRIWPPSTDGAVHDLPSIARTIRSTLS